MDQPSGFTPDPRGSRADIDSRRARVGPYIAIFPLINTPYPSAAVGLLLRHYAELGTFSTPSELAGPVDALDAHWDDAHYWVYEESVHTMSTEDSNVYGPFMDLYSPAENEKAYEKHMLPDVYAAWKKLWGTGRLLDDRRFRRLPVALDAGAQLALREYEGPPGQVGSKRTARERETLRALDAKFSPAEIAESRKAVRSGYVSPSPAKMELERGNAPVARKRQPAVGNMPVD